MMTQQPGSETRPLVARADLEQLGFAAEQIARLGGLAASYPLSEFLDTREEWERPVFLKWRHTTGRAAKG